MKNFLTAVFVLFLGSTFGIIATHTDEVSAQNVSPAFCNANSLEFYEGRCVSVQERDCLASGGSWGPGPRDPQGGSSPSICSCPDKQLDGECVSQSELNCEVNGGGSFIDGSCVCPEGGRLNVNGICIPDEDQNRGDCEPRNSFLGIPTWYRGLEFKSSTCEIIVDIDDFRDTSNNGATNPIIIIVVNIIAIITRLAGIIAVIFVIVGGFKYVLSDGDPQKTAEARKTIINAMVGAIIVSVGAIVVDVIHGVFT